MDLIDTFGKLLLADLPPTWVSTINDADFSTAREKFDEFDIYYEDTDLFEVFEELGADIKDWLADSDSHLPPISEGDLNESQVPNLAALNADTGKTWHNLCIRKVTPRPLLALLSTFIKTDYKELTTLSEITEALSAAKFYFVLCSISGARIYGVFNYILYVQVVELLKLAYLLHSQNERKNKKNKKKGKNANESQVDDDDEGTLGPPITPQDHSELIRLISEAMDALGYFLDHGELNFDRDAFNMTVQTLAQVTRVERKTGNILEKRPPNPNTTAFLAYKAYHLLLRLLSENHCDVNEGPGIILRYFLPVLNVAEHEGLLIPPKELTVIIDHTIGFLKLLIEKEPEACNLWLKCFIQQLVVRLPEKADLRSKGVVIISELMNLFPYSAFHFTSLWAISFVANSTTVKHRLALLEVIDKLLLSDEKMHDESEDINSLVEKKRPKRKEKEYTFNFDINLGENTEGDDDNNKENCDKEKGEEKRDEENDDEKEDNDSSMEVDEDQDPDKSKDENENGNDNNQRSSLFECFIGLIFFKLTDASPTIKAKALSIINQALNSRNYLVREILDGMFLAPYSELSIIDKVIPDERDIFPMGKLFSKKQTKVKLPPNPLPGGTKVMRIIEILVRDEKVFVRKNAWQLMKSIFLLNRKWITKKRLQMMVNACKDHSVIVRKVLISCLSDLVIEYPGDEDLQRCWVEGAMPLMTDNEIKLVEKLVELTENIILNNMVSYSNRRNLLHDLPWKMLNWITKLGKRNLFRFTMRQWCLESKIDDSIVNLLKTHIGTENNLPAWMLLVCISEFKESQACSFILDYFNENILNGSDLNEYHSVLVIEALFINWKNFKEDKREELVIVLKENIEKFNVPIALIARTFDICQRHDKPAACEWSESVVKRCEAYLNGQVGPDSTGVVDDEETLCLCLFTLSEAIFLAPQVIQSQTIETICRLIDVRNIGTYTTNYLWKGPISGRVKTEAVTFLGRLCLQDAFIAKATVPLLGALLNFRDVPASVKINTLIGMCDLCIKFTSSVECYLGDMALNLKDKNLQVRSTSLSLFIRLLQEDYVKLKFPIFFYMLTMLLDPDKQIRDQTLSFFINSAISKYPGIMTQFITQALFFFNDYENDGAYKKTGNISPEELVAFSLKGEANVKGRRKLYSFMLEHMPDDQRFKSGYRICTEILDLVAEGGIVLNEMSQNLVKDSFYVMACEEMRLAQMKTKDTVNDEDGSELSEVAVVSNVTRKVMVTELAKRNQIENIVPIFVKLRKMFYEMKSPLLRDLMICMREMMKDFKEHIEEILSADKELSEEIAHDLKGVQSEEIENIGSDMAPENLREIIDKVRAHCERLSNGMIAGDDETPEANSNSLPPARPQGDKEAGVVGYSSPSTPSPKLLSPPRRTSQRKSSSESSSRRRLSSSSGQSSESPIPPNIIPKVERVTPLSTPQHSPQSPLPKSRLSSVVPRPIQIKKSPLVETSQTMSDTPVVKGRKRREPAKKKASNKC